MKKENRKLGFTMVEMLIAVAIFVMFTSVLISSYASIVQSQRDANEFRRVYVEARAFFDEIVGEVRDNVVYYGDNESTEFATGLSELTLLSKDGERVLKVFEEEGQVILRENQRCGEIIDKYELLAGDVVMRELSFYVTPGFDPFLADNVLYNSLAFHPKVTIYAEFERERSGGKEPYVVDFQTTVSSRYYGEVPDVDFTCI